jgi:PAS domain S-box-containing protein
MPIGADKTHWEDAVGELVRDPPSPATQVDAHYALVRLLAQLRSAAPLNLLLDELAKHVETWSKGIYCTVWLVDSTGRMLQPGAAPSLPRSYADALGRIPIAVGQGSCGTAAARREMVFVEDVERSDLWATYAPIALSHGLRACWSVPIIDDARALLGTLALYYRERRAPSAAEIDLIQCAAFLASFVIQRHRDSERLKASEARLAAGVWGTDIGLWESGILGEYVWFDNWYDRFDIDPCLGPDQDRRWRERIHTEDIDRYESANAAAVSGLTDHYVVEYRIRTRSGAWRWLHERGKVTARAAKGKAQQFLGVCFCVDDQKKLEAALHAAENRYELAVSAARLPVWQYDVCSDTVTGNLYWHRTVGHKLTFDEAQQRVETWLSDIHPDDIERNSKLFAREATDETGFYQSEFRIRMPSGEYKWLLDRGRVVERAADGAPTKVVGISLDIDAQKRMEMDLRESEQRFRGAFEFAAIGMALVALDGRWLRVNRSLCEIVGYAAEELLATDFQSITHPDDLHTNVGSMRQMLDGSLSHCDMEKRYLHKDGHILWVRLSVSLVRDATGDPLYFVSQLLDITEQRQLTEDLRLARADLQAILDNVPARITSWHADWTNRFVNQTAATQYGVPAGEAIGKHARELIGEKRYRIAKPYMAAAQAGERQSYEQVDLQPDGSRRYSHVTYIPKCKDGRVTALYVLGSDVTELRESHRRIRELVQRLETVREEERHSIAQALHEGIAQDLFAMKLSLAHLQAQGTDRVDVTHVCQELAEAIDKCMVATRQIANELRPASLAHLSVVVALKDHAEYFGEISGLTIRVTEITPLPKLDEATGLILFRAGQEALTNVARHARASRVDIDLRADSEYITMDIADDGIGIDGSALAKAGSLGLLGIRERIAAVGGALVVRKNAGAGAIVTVQLPRLGSGDD